MKRIAVILILLIGTFSYAQIPAYYSSIDFNQSGLSLKSQLAGLITSTHVEITYSDCWDVLKISDLETGSNDYVLLVYGHDDMDGNPVTDRTRNKNLNGGANGEWNREHVFPKSLGSPDLGTSGPGSDAHNLRASDVQQNSNRANKTFIDGSGVAGSNNNSWYPGDEWKGDCARIVMYMYVRYGTRCLPSAVGTGSTNATDPEMMNLFLDWNVDDPVSQFEQDRNQAIYNSQGNRNPFIDNPRIATKIWGGPIAEDTWGVLATEKKEDLQSLLIYPMPVTGDVFQISGINTLKITSMEMYDMSGRLVGEIQKEEINSNGQISIEHFSEGTYTLSIIFENATLRRKIIIQ
ncbi:MAG: endonuclease [Crocinitomicaceae bacterium]|nr:endonuclease [Crocinitomicaceae bacterium]